MDVEKQIGLTRRQSALVGRTSYLESAFLGGGKPLEIITGFCTDSDIRSGYKETLQLS